MNHLIEKITPYYQSIRQQIHAHPELRYEETKTAALVAQELTNMGLKVLTGIGKTGVVGLLETSRPGKTIALRADMDALPIEELGEQQYKSKISGKMHACGHDGHTASLLATAKVLCEIKDQLQGTVKFIFQPAEEGGAGALAMIEDGVLLQPPVDVIFGYHNHPGTKAGVILARVGCIMYGNWEFSLNITGKGGHAAMPDMAINPIEIAAELVLKIKAICLSLDDEIEPTIATITQIKGGFTTNVIPETALISGTIRAPSQARFETANTMMLQAIDEVAKRYQATINLNMAEIYPPTLNTAPETEYVLKQAAQCLGEENALYKKSSGRASEDFSYFLQKIPGCYFFIGNGEDSASCHNPHFDYNDDILPIAVQVMTALVLNYPNR